MIRDLFLHNWQLKLVSLLVSLMLFWYVQYSRTTTRVLNIRVDRPEVPANLVLSSRVPSFMQVKIYGPSEMIDFNVSDFKIVLENPRPAAGENTYRSVIQPELPEGIGAVYQREVTVNLDRLMIRKLPVVPNADINLATGYRAGYMWTNPATISISGPAAVVGEMERLYTEKIAVAGSLPFYSTKVLLSPLPDFVNLASGQPFDVEVNLNVIPEQVELSLGEESGLFQVTDIPIRCSNDVRGMTMHVLGDRKASILLTVQEETQRNRIKKDQFTATVYCPVYFDTETREILPAPTIMNVPIRVEDRLGRSDIAIIDAEPQFVSVEFEKLVIKAPSDIRRGFQEHLIR